jgi:hypothetical protein
MGLERNAIHGRLRAVTFGEGLNADRHGANLRNAGVRLYSSTQAEC